MTTSLAPEEKALRKRGRRREKLLSNYQDVAKQKECKELLDKEVTIKEIQKKLNIKKEHIEGVRKTIELHKSIDKNHLPKTSYNLKYNLENLMTTEEFGQKIKMLAQNTVEHYIVKLESGEVMSPQELRTIVEVKSMIAQQDYVEKDGNTHGEGWDVLTIHQIRKRVLNLDSFEDVEEIELNNNVPDDFKETYQDSVKKK